MKTEHLRYVLEIAKCGSINKAAKNLFMVQSYLSNIVKSLEDTLGFDIFYRTSCGIIPTQEGKLLLAYAKSIIAEEDKILCIPQHFQKNSALSVASLFSVRLFDTFLAFREKYNGIEYNDIFSESTFSAVKEMLTSGKRMLGFTVVTQSMEHNEIEREYEKDNIEIVSYFPGTCMGIIMAPQHPLSQKRQITLDDVKHFPLVAYEGTPSDFFRPFMDISNNDNILYVSNRGGYYDIIRKGNFLGLSLDISKDYSTRDWLHLASFKP